MLLRPFYKSPARILFLVQRARQLLDILQEPPVITYFAFFLFDQLSLIGPLAVTPPLIRLSSFGSGSFQLNHFLSSPVLPAVGHSNRPATISPSLFFPFEFS